MNEHTYTVVDLETTGHSPSRGDRIIQIAIVFIEEGEVLRTYSRFVNPERPIPAFIQQLTNITDEEVADALPFEAIAREVAELLEGCVFIAHNTDFDLSFLQSEFKRCGVSKWTGKKIDTVELSKILFPTSPSYRLQDLAEELDIALPAAHRADDDAKATAHLFLACLDKMRYLPARTLHLLHKRSFSLRSDISMLLLSALNAARLSAAREDFPEFRGIPYKRPDSLPGSLAGHAEYPETTEEKMAFLNRAFSDVEKRESQFRFMDTVMSALNAKTEVAAEVPTGIGKTIAYLLPAAVHSINSGKPVVVSTYTNHLIDRMTEFDVKRAGDALGIKLRATVLKGREQYISLRKLEELMRIIDESYDETFTILQILVWLTETETGDLNELNVSGGGQLFVDRVRKHAASYGDEQAADFHLRAIRSCKRSNVIITNHQALLSDMQREESVFQDAGGLVIDEAHQLINAADSAEETVFAYTTWKYVAGQLSSEAEGQLLDQIDRLKRRHHVFDKQAKLQLSQLSEQFLSDFDDAVHQLTGNQYTGQTSGKGNRTVMPLSALSQSREPFARTAESLRAYYEYAEHYVQALETDAGRLSKKERAFLAEWQYWVRELAIKAGEWVHIFLDAEDSYSATWVEKDQRSIPGSLQVVQRTVDGSRLIQGFIGRMKEQQMGIIWTSGTLAVQQDPRFVTRRLGIDDSVPLVTFEAPPHFYDGANIFIVSDMPDIQQVQQSDYIVAVADAIVQTVLATGGRLFALFTSQEMLRQTYELIMDSELLTEYAMIAQGISSGSRMKLLKSFRQFEKSVLFGTNSFWEGVDVPGEALTAIIVVRLPFTSPDEPVFKERALRLSEQGMNPFTEFALPEAIMRLRQGFGRLIRTSTDKGFFIILDRRIETKSYGRRFLASLPDVPVKKVSLAHMVNELEHCYNE